MHACAVRNHATGAGRPRPLRVRCRTTPWPPPGGNFEIWREENGRGGEIRTHDLLYPKQTRYQAALRPDFSKCPWLSDGPSKGVTVAPPPWRWWPSVPLDMHDMEMDFQGRKPSRKFFSLAVSAALRAGECTPSHPPMSAEGVPRCLHIWRCGSRAGGSWDDPALRPAGRFQPYPRSRRHC